MEALTLPSPTLLGAVGGSTVVAIAVFVTLLCACIIIGHLLEDRPWANASIASLLLGLCAGLLALAITRGKSSHILVFSKELFFIYLLPPIVFNAGFQLHKKNFFRNFSMILLFGVIGTLISFSIITTGANYLFKQIGLKSLKIQDYLAIGAIFSATDSVCTIQVLNQEETPLLYSLVFGEGVVNDATSIVLFNAVQTLNFNDIGTSTTIKVLGAFVYLFTTSTALGIAVGLLSSYVIRKLNLGRYSSHREVAILLLMAYLSYILAELLSLSGILTIFFCGIIMSQYTWNVITEPSQISTRHTFATISFISETFIFLYVGMDALDIDKWNRSSASVGRTIAISGTLLASLMLGRAAFVFSLVNIANYFRTGVSAKIDIRQQFILWWAGLMRGAVTIALSYQQFTETSSSSNEDAFMITTSIIVVLFSTVVFGSITKPLIKAILLRHPISQSCEHLLASRLEDHHFSLLENTITRRNSLGLLIRYPTSTIHYYWRKFDDKYMKPVFGGYDSVPDAPISPYKG